MYVIKTQIGTSKWWAQRAGGHHSEVVVSTGLTATSIRIFLQQKNQATSFNNSQQREFQCRKDNSIIIKKENQI
jgi:hypothetical protein